MATRPETPDLTVKPPSQSVDGSVAVLSLRLVGCEFSAGGKQYWCSALRLSQRGVIIDGIAAATRLGNADDRDGGRWTAPGPHGS